MMSDDEVLLALAQEAGLEVRWSDAKGTAQTVRIDTLRAVLAALDLPAGSRAEIDNSRARLRQEKERPPPLIIARASETIFLNGGKFAEFKTESGERKTVRLCKNGIGRTSFRGPRAPGYYRIEIGGQEIALAVSPPRALRPKDMAPGKLAGIAVQVYALRGGTSGGFGDFSALGDFARTAGRVGFDAVMASPTHALFGAEVSRFSPYSPSTRLFFNPLFADVTHAGGAPLREALGDDTLIDWKTAGERKQRALRKAFAQFRRETDRRRFEAFCHEGGERLLAHALFEALDSHFRGKGVAGFRHWPAGFESPAATKISAFAKEEHEVVEYQLFLQWLSSLSAEAAQAKARKDMAIGIVADLAVGMDPEGSHAWSAPQELLRGLHVGAPPDAFFAHGQDWGLTALSPRGLRMLGYAPFIATLRAAMRHAGGVRIDHALGLRRLWVVPAGASPTEGVYLRYPKEEMLRLIALESHRNNAVVVGEDLGTVPEGFRDDLARAGVLGMQVLWFERNGEGFVKPSAWRCEAMATTTTHDLPTVAGWWTAHDIDWRKRVGHLGQNAETESSARAADRERLWTALRNARCATGDTPPPGDFEKALLGALSYVGKTRCALAFAPIEDIAADLEQPNLPGTIDEHPNWRRRIKKGDLLHDRAARKRIRTFLAARRRS
jgi:4-alpha-glucanotransferase